ncbi:unnamed protein product [Owenia fusiformis]|uniref:Uncharacterized protein n=1 Tax=Owenia fusiformis TaxID=6347 RepID=A0A8J1XWG2_OWEFU|nr:unnamed protein product [Owenia fusiformis]
MEVFGTLLILLISHVSLASGSSEGKQIVKDLFRGYDKTVRPVKSHNESVRVALDISIRQITDLNERLQVISTAIWIRLGWDDHYLQWNTSDYGGLHKIHVSPKKIWTPDIQLYDDVREDPADWTLFKAVVYSKGRVWWNVPILFTCSCKLNVKYFPYDQQVCSFKFGSWTYDGFELDLVNRSSRADTKQFLDNGEWDLIDVPAERNLLYYTCCQEPYPDVTFKIIIRRRPLYYIFNLILPCIFIVAIAPFAFFLPPASGERISLVITLLLALTVFLLLVAEVMPPQSEVVPLIGQYFGVAIGLLAMSAIVSVFTVHFQHRGSRVDRVPRWARRFILGFLAKVLCLNIATGKGTIPKMNMEKRKRVSNRNSSLRVTLVDELDTNNSNLPKKENNQTKPDSDINVSPNWEPTKFLRAILGLLFDMSEQQKADGDDEDCRREWQLVAMVIDRCLMFIFLFFTLAYSVSFLTYRPSYE